MTDAPSLPPEDDDEADLAAPPIRMIEVTLGESDAGLRLDKALAQAVPDVSRARLQALMASGAVTREDGPLGANAAKALPGLYRIAVPALVAAEPEAEDIPLVVLFEDEHLIVIDKPAGMAAHPGPGVYGGTLVNALLFHCAGSLAGVGGVVRPGIVHRLDKETTGVMVAAKTDAAHAGLSALFATHDIERRYIALVRGAPYPTKGTITSLIGRSSYDRKKMAVVKSGGREAITHYRTERAYGPSDRPLAAKIVCTLETGRTHQIRVHMAAKGTPCLGDPVYGSARPSAPVIRAIAASGLQRQALHAAVLGFIHPITGEALRFETDLPDDMARLQSLLMEF
jgi:23S rRNA pseudouridine1911/1915/1917 synthase